MRIFYLLRPFLCFMTVTDLKNEILKALTPVVGSGEATAMMREMLYLLKNYSATDIIIYGDRTVLDQSVALAREWTRRVVEGEPLQYILGTAHFMGMELKVSPAVLIPRPETSQLVDLITNEYASKKALSVLDIGTGSGCIAIALARALPYADVTAVDISDAALAVARDNGKRLHTNINFLHDDALNLSINQEFDIIVSNPPYIAETERNDMEARVYEHEPSNALFVSDANPLVFYRAISLYAVKSLRPGGALFFEINPLFTDELRNMLNQHGWRVIDIIRDYKGNYRFATCKL